MNRRERWMLSLAVGVSVLLHAAVAWNVMGMRLEATPRSVLFERPDRPSESVAVSVSRSTDDVVVSDDGSADDEAPAEPEPADDSSAVAEQAERLLENMDLSDVLEPDPQALPEPDVSAADELGVDEPAHLDAALPEPGPAASVDASGELLALAEPTVSLPEFVAPTDDVSAEPSEDAADTGPSDPLDDDDLRALDDLLAEDTSGTAAGDTGGEGEGSGDGDAEMADPLAALVSGAGDGSGGGGGGSGPGVGAGGLGMDQLDPTDPTGGGGEPLVGVPDLTRTLMEVPTITGETDEEEEPVVHLDDDFRYRLRLTHEHERPRGVFDLLGVTEQDEEDGWFEVRVAPRQSLRRLEPLHKDVVWAIDTSASISQWRVNQMRQGVRQALGTLNEGDRFNIVLFAEQVRVLSREGLLEADDENIEKAQKFLSEANSEGGTDVNRALSELLVRNVPPDRVYQIMLLSDGVPTRGSINPQNIINLISRDNARVASIYGVGVGEEQDRRLLDMLAYRNKGYVVYPENPQRTAATIAELATRLRYPVVRDATFSAAGVDAERIYPQTPRDIYLGEPLSLYGRFGDEARRLSMQISGINRDQELNLTFSLDFGRAEDGDADVPRDWAFWKLHHLYRQILRDRDTPALRDEVEQLRRRYQLDTPY